MFCAACNCNMQGSETMQCDRQTGACPCVPGVTGEKCDRCARGTTGELPNCTPCGECFDDWDVIITDLRRKLSSILFTQPYPQLFAQPYLRLFSQPYCHIAVETETFLRIASNISDQGIDAFDKEFSEMEEKLREVERIVNGTNVTPQDLQQLRDRIDELRSEVKNNVKVTIKKI